MYSNYFYFYPNNLKLGTWYRATVTVDDSALAVLDTIANSTFRTIPFSLSTLSPANGGVLQNSADPLSLTFNSAVDKLTVVASLVVSPGGSNNYTVSSNQMNISILPFSGAWKAGEDYTLVLNTATLLDINGSTVEKTDSVYHFSAPQVNVVDHSPLNNVTDVDTSANVIFTFNTIMDTASTNPAFSIEDADGNPFAGGTLSWNAALTQLTFQPSGTPFSSGTVYTAAIDTSAADTYGVNMQAPFSITFTVK